MSRPADPPTRRGRRFSDERGSLLLTAMLFAVGLAIVLGSYLSLSRTTLKLAYRVSFAQDASNLAEAGLEEALYCFNQMNSGNSAANAWNGWTIKGANAMLTLPTFNLDQSAIGIVKVYVTAYAGSGGVSKVISQASVLPLISGKPVIKTLQIEIQGQAAAAPGLVAFNGLSLKNDSIINSFNSNPSGNPNGPWAKYENKLSRPYASVAVLAGKISVAKGAIYGDLFLGPKVSPPPVDDFYGDLTTNYSYSYSLPTFPTPASVSKSYDLGKSIPRTLPGKGDVPASDGRYYYFCNKTTIDDFTVLAGCGVTIVGTDTQMDSGIVLQSMSSLHVYMDGPLTLKGGDDLNTNGWAGALRIYTTTTKKCTIGNKSQLYAWLEAPNSDLQATGGSETSMLVGFFLADTITGTGSMDFHYDESLQPAGSGSGNGWKVGKWQELQSAADLNAVVGLTGNFLQ